MEKQRNGECKKRGTIQLYMQIVCLLHSAQGRSQSTQDKKRISGDKCRIWFPIVRTYRPVYPPLVHTTSASFKSRIQQQNSIYLIRQRERLGSRWA